MSNIHYEIEAIIHKQESEQAVQCAVDQATTDLPYARVIEATLYSKIVPLPNENLRIKGPRWYVKANIHNLTNNSQAEALYRVWLSQGEWKAAQVKITS